MIRLRTVYDPTAKDNWVLTDKPIFNSGKKSWRRNSYYLSSPKVGMFDINKFKEAYVGYNPPIIGGKCLSVWSK